MTDEPKEKVKKEKFMVGEVATQTEPVIVDTETEQQYNLFTAIAKIMNDIANIKKNIS